MKNIKKIKTKAQDMKDIIKNKLVGQMNSLKVKKSSTPTYN